MSGWLAQSYLLNPDGDGQWTPLAGPGGSRAGGLRDYAPAVMYDSGKVIFIGGGSDKDSHAPTAAAEIIDLTAEMPAWRATRSMHHPRRQHNATILPDGTVLVTGGTGGLGAAVTARLLAERWRVVVPWKVQSELGRLPDHPDLELVEADLLDTQDIEAVVESAAAHKHQPLRAVVNLVGQFFNCRRLEQLALVGTRPDCFRETDKRIHSGEMSWVRKSAGGNIRNPPGIARNLIAKTTFVDLL